MLAAGPATSAFAAEQPSPLEFGVLGMHCDACAGRAREALAALPGATEAAVDFASGRGRVAADGPLGRDDVRRALGTLGFEARFGDEPLDSDPLPDAVRARLDIRTVSRGEPVRIKQALAPGKLTIFDYYADWCGPCHLLSPKLERLVLRYDNVALRKVDIVDYESRAARQATREFRLPGLPFTRVFDERGRLLGEVQGNDIEAIETILRPHVRPRQDAERETPATTGGSG